jgi:hypothetical protein
VKFDNKRYGTLSTISPPYGPRRHETYAETFTLILWILFSEGKEWEQTLGRDCRTLADDMGFVEREWIGKFEKMREALRGVDGMKVDIKEMMTSW